MKLDDPKIEKLVKNSLTNEWQPSPTSAKSFRGVTSPDTLKQKREDKMALQLVDKRQYKLSNRVVAIIEQQYNGTPVYGSHIIVEINGNGPIIKGFSPEDTIDFDSFVQLLLNPPQDIKHKDEIIEFILKSDKLKDIHKYVELKPTLYYYYHKDKWRLVYVIDTKINLPNPTEYPDEFKFLLDFLSKSQLSDFVVDACSGDIIDSIPHPGIKMAS